MSRYLPTIIALLALAIPGPPGMAHDGFTPIALGEEEHFGWAILTRDGKSMSTGVLAWETLRKIKKQYGPELLVIADRDERYVITDPGFIRDAQRATRKIQDMKPEIAELAEAQSRLSIGEVSQGERERLKVRERALEKAIQDAERDGEATKELEQKLFEVRLGLQINEGMERQSRLTADEKRDLIRRRDRATERVNRGMSRIHAEVRDILEEAKSRNLARLLD
jgi:hypothetical protein